MENTEQSIIWLTWNESVTQQNSCRSLIFAKTLHASSMDMYEVTQLEPVSGTSSSVETVRTDQRRPHCLCTRAHHTACTKVVKLLPLVPTCNCKHLHCVGVKPPLTLDDVSNWTPSAFFHAPERLIDPILTVTGTKIELTHFWEAPVSLPLPVCLPLWI